MYKEITFYPGSTIKEAVKELLDYKEKGKLVKGDFNGKTLFSDTVTLDSAYKEITGKTFEEFEEMERKQREEYRRKEAEYKNKISELTKKYIEEGHAILSENKWKLWDKIVPIRLGDLYKGFELRCCLDIIKLINENSNIEIIKKELDNQGHSGMSYSLVCGMIEELHEKGKEILDKINKGD